MTTTSEHFTSRLPTKRVAADCLIFDPEGRFLIVEPTYKSTGMYLGASVRSMSRRGAALNVR